MKRSGPLLALLAATIVAILASIGACSGNVIPRGGLMLVISTDGTLTPDRLHVDVTSADSATVYRNADYKIPAEATLPTTLAIASNGDPTASVAIDVSVWTGAQPLDLRQNQVQQIPTDRVAEMDIVLSSKCSPLVTTVGGQAQSKCPPGQTCDPTTGGCVNDLVNGSELPTYDGSRDADGSADADGCDVQDADGLGLLGCPCSSPGALACNGHAQKQMLVCTGGTWGANGACSTGSLCDSRPGSNQGTCATIDPLCTSATPGQKVCGSATTVVQCGPDLLSHTPVQTCAATPAQACLDGACLYVCTLTITSSYNKTNPYSSPVGIAYSMVGGGGGGCWAGGGGGSSAILGAGSLVSYAAGANGAAGNYGASATPVSGSFALAPAASLVVYVAGGGGANAGGGGSGFFGGGGGGSTFGSGGSNTGGAGGGGAATAGSSQTGGQGGGNPPYAGGGTGAAGGASGKGGCGGGGFGGGGGALCGLQCAGAGGSNGADGVGGYAPAGLGANNWASATTLPAAAGQGGGCYGGGNAGLVILTYLTPTGVCSL